MAEITPITREEFYLAKAGGQDVPVPSAVTREEYYLEKLTNDNVVVPSPVTRREKFLYFACGGEIDLPSEERMTRLERLIAKAGGMDVSTPTAVTRLEKFWANVEGSGWKTLTGVLPLTFTAKGGTAVDWVIRGNDDVGENIVPPIRIVNGWKQGYRNYINGDYVPTYSWGEWLYDVYIPINSASFTFWATNISAPSVTFYFYDSDKQYLSDAAKSANNYNNVIISNISPEAAYMQFAFRTLCKSEQEIIDNNYQVMLVKGSTTPDFEPYQIGVGERTKNLLEITAETQTINGVTFTVDETMGTITADGMENSNTTIGINNYITVNATGSYILSGCPAEGSSQTWEVTIQDGSTIVGRARPNPATVTLTAGVLYTVRCIVRNRVRCDNLVYKPMVRKANTSDTFVPYGYQIPLTVSQQGQSDKSYNIYIGDSPLTEGETVSKTSTGVDIELFEGENTVSTTLYNKPTMEIKYK